MRSWVLGLVIAGLALFYLGNKAYIKFEEMVKPLIEIKQDLDELRARLEKAESVLKRLPFSPLREDEEESGAGEAGALPIGEPPDETSGSL